MELITQGIVMKQYGSSERFSSFHQEKDLPFGTKNILVVTTSHKQLPAFLIELFAYYFALPQKKIRSDSDLADDIERMVWAQELEVPFEDVTYWRIFFGQDEDGNAVGGMEDKGIMIATMFMLDFSDLVGIKEVDDAADATFEAMDDKFGSYYDCATISDLADLIFTVCEKLKPKQE